MTLPVDGTGVVGERYVLADVIGRGGMATVYRATDTVLGRYVAVKLLREVTDDPSDRARFLAEATTLAKLNHPGLVTVLDAGTSGDRPFLVMELIDGPDLAEHCAGEALQPSRVVAVGTQVADGLAHAHAAGVVHRDVKPSNIMLGRDGRVWLTDFGIARLLGDTAKHTWTGMMIGSPAYFSPEQVRGQAVTPATDIYSLGLVLLEMLTGHRAYPQSPTEAALARLTSPPAVPSWLSEGWRRLLLDMTALDAPARPTAEEVAGRLRRLSEGQEPTAVTAAMAREPGPLTAASAPGSGPTVVAPTVSADPARHRGPWWSHLARPTRLTLAAAVGAAGLLVVLATAPQWGGETGGGADVPPGVPPRLEQPLRELHDAVRGVEQ